jgi:hypothetical protein
MDPVPDPLLLRKSNSAGSPARDLWICSYELRPLDHMRRSISEHVLLILPSHSATFSKALWFRFLSWELATEAHLNLLLHRTALHMHFCRFLVHKQHHKNTRWVWWIGRVICCLQVQLKHYLSSPIAVSHAMQVIGLRTNTILLYNPSPINLFQYMAIILLRTHCILQYYFVVYTS